MIESERILYLDTETEPIGPRGYAPPPFVAAGLKVGTEPVVITQDLAEARRVIEEALAADWIVAAHHAAFDLEVLGIVPSEVSRVHCTMVVDYLQRLARDDDRRRRGFRKLADLVRLPGKGTTQRSFRRHLPLTEEQRDYLVADVEAVAGVYAKQAKERIPGGYREVTMQVRAALACSRMTQTGIPLNRGEIGAQIAAVQRRKHDAARELRRVGLHIPARVGPKGGRYKEHLNTAAMRELVRLWYEELGQVPPTTPAGKVSIDKDTLSGFQDREEARQWKTYTDADKMLGTFLEGLKSRGDVVHPNYRSMVRSGRTSCSDPNLQQIPSRDWRGQIKRCFVAPRGRVLYELDYAQLELCALAYVTKGQLLEQINAGVDVHRYLGSIYFKKPAEEVTKHERFLMKACFTPDAEFLTPHGWKTYDELGDLPVMQATPISDGPPVLSWAQPMGYVDKVSPDIVNLDSENVRLSVTPDHRMLVQTGSGSPAVCMPKDVPARRHVWGAGHFGAGVPRHPDLVRLAVAVVADGSFSGRQIVFGFTKRRKVRRLKKLLRRLGDSPTQKTYSNGDNKPRVSLRVSPWLTKRIKELVPDKRLTWDWLHYSYEARAAAVDEAQFWDGTKIRRSYTLSSVDRQNIDVLQAMAISVGRRATEQQFRPANGKHRECFKLTVADRATSRADSVSVEFAQYGGRVVCLSVPSSFLVVRQRGTVSIQGNCNFGLPGGMGIARFRRHIRSYGLPDPGDSGARRLRDAWLEAFPEMSRYLEDSTQYSKDVLRVWAGWDVESEMWDFAWALAEQIEIGLHRDGSPLPAQLSLQLSQGIGSPDLERWLARRRVVIPPGGRTRHPVSYAEQHNTVFQGLAANLCKIALARVTLEYEPALVHAFVHDSLLISAEAGPEQEAVVDEVMDIMLGAAGAVLPGVRCGVEACGPGWSWLEAKEGGERSKYIKI